ncbi:MAG TPA: hypothetical protein VFM00_12930 [Candidatus Eisenbacteria bacterium]|nr:hypothetical protein [Candidatus Eisenbacteria bacterium]
MSTPRTRSETPVRSASSSSESSAVLGPAGLLTADSRDDAELHRAIESAASRLLGLALARGVEEQDPDEE